MAVLIHSCTPKPSMYFLNLAALRAALTRALIWWRGLHILANLFSSLPQVIVVEMAHRGLFLFLLLFSYRLGSLQLRIASTVMWAVTKSKKRASTMWMSVEAKIPLHPSRQQSTSGGLWVALGSFCSFLSGTHCWCDKRDSKARASVPHQVMPLVLQTGW